MYRFSRFSRFASQIARSIAHPSAFLVVLGLVCVWLLSGPMMRFNSLWQTVFNSFTTAVTFLLLFLIQHTQARETAAIQLKLNELIRASEGSHNALLDIEQMTNRDYDLIRENYSLLAQQAREQLKEGNVKWATARIQMESLDSLLDPAHLDTEETEQEPTSLDTSTDSRLLDTPSNPILDRLAQAAATALEVPMVLVSLVGHEFQVFPGQAGLAEPYLSLRRTPLSHTFCKQVVDLGKSVVMNDVQKHPLAENSPAIAESGTAAYVGMPLVIDDNRVVGSFCAIDRQPRVWTEAELALLQAFADTALPEIKRLLANDRAGLETKNVTLSSGARHSYRNIPRKGVLRTATPMVLIADDSATNRTLLARYLAAEGYATTVFATGEEALQYLETATVDLILLDIMMTGLDGEQVLQNLQAHDRLKHIPVVMISALDEQESINRCLRKGARDYLLKPFTQQALHACIHKHLAFGASS